jgi:hypothetical protein
MHLILDATTLFPSLLILIMGWEKIMICHMSTGNCNQLRWLSIFLGVVTHCGLRRIIIIAVIF